MATYRIIQIGSLRDGWAIEVDGVITRSAPTAAPLAAWLDARLAGANEFDADDIAKAIAARPPPSFEERMAVFFPSGRPEPSRDPFTPRPSHNQADTVRWVSLTRGTMTCSPVGLSFRHWPSLHLARCAILGAPLPRGLTSVAVYSRPNRRCLVLFIDIVAAISDEGPSVAIGDHVGPEVAAIGMAYRNGPAVAIDAPRFAGDVAFANQCAQVFGGSPPRWPVVGTRLVLLGRVDSPKPVRHAIDSKRIAINHAGGLGNSWRGKKCQESGQHGQFHRRWLARD
jgi:hypothetical protein